MISRRRGTRCPDARLDALIGQALRARIAGAYPPQDGWARLTARLAREDWRTISGRAAGLRPWRHALARCCELLDRVLPLLEMPTAHAHEPRGARLAMHWRWLHLHRVTVRLLC